MTQENIADKLLFPLFRSIDNAYKTKYKRDVWDQFENAIRSAAYTARLSTFYQNILLRLPLYIEIQHLRGINEVIGSGLDKQILNWLRDETSYLVLLARMLNEQRKADYKELQAENLADSAPKDDLSYII